MRDVSLTSARIQHVMSTAVHTWVTAAPSRYLVSIVGLPRFIQTPMLSQSQRQKKITQRQKQRARRQLPPISRERSSESFQTSTASGARMAGPAQNGGTPQMPTPQNQCQCLGVSTWERRRTNGRRLQPGPFPQIWPFVVAAPTGVNTPHVSAGTDVGDIWL